MVHPSITSLQEMISQTPHKHNHIYHVLDAADFPLSLIPNIQRLLSLTPQRSHNRRARTGLFYHGRTMDMSFIITRADLLAPRKEQVDSLMPYLVQVLRDALGGAADSLRLGNVRCVSAKRGWWTSQVKEAIWERGGGGWMVGKVNVGKSNLFEQVYPKGHAEQVTPDTVRRVTTQRTLRQQTISGAVMTSPRLVRQLPSRHGDESQAIRDSLLPSTPPETPFPVLPLVSSVPGTTAAPIRLSYGGGKGELIDLPGLDRGDLGAFVVNEHKQDLVMRKRPRPEQLSVKPGQSLLVGQIVRITPLTPGLTVLAYPFVPLKSHVTSTEKAISIHTQTQTSRPYSPAKPGIGHHMASAGTFSIKWDVTKQRAGPLTRKNAAGLNAKVLPFIVFSIDILIEGCGWVELVAQLRKRDFEMPTPFASVVDDRPYPQIEIHSPGGRYIGVRRPMNAWLLNGQKPGLSVTNARPRRSMQGVKKRLKQNRLVS